MLEDAQNSLPAELSDRFSLNRFFTFQRDIINDELAANVPDLIEDALENPTGTYQQVSRFQNEKLMDIDRSTIEIQRTLDEMFLLLQKVSQQSGGGGILDDILSALGLGNLFGGGKDKKKKQRKKSGGGGAGGGGQSDKDNKKKKKSFFEKIFGDKKSGGTRGRGGLVGGGGRTGLILNLLGFGAGSALLLDLMSEDVDLKDMFRNLVEGEYNDELGTAGAIAAISAAPAAVTAGAGAVKNIFKGPSAGSLDAPAAVGPSSQTLEKKQYKVKDLTADQQKELIDKGKLKGQSQAQVMEQFASKKDIKAAGLGPSGPFGPSSTNATNIPKTQGFFGGLKSYVSSSVGKAFEYTKGAAKGTAYVAAAYALYDFYDAISNLPTDLSEEEYRKEVSRLARETIALTGLTMFGAFVGAVAGGSAGSFVPGAGNAVGAIAGFLGGIIGGSLAEYFYADEVGSVANSPEVTKLVDQLVDWMMIGIKAAKGASESVSDALTIKQKVVKLTSKDEYANLSSEELAAKGLKRLPQVRTGRGGTSQYTNYEVVDDQKYKAAKTSNSSGTSAFTGMPQVSAPLMVGKENTAGNSTLQLKELTTEQTREIIKASPDITDENAIMDLARKMYPNHGYKILKRIIERYKKEYPGDQSSLSRSGKQLAALQIANDILGPAAIQRGASYASLGSATMTDAVESYVSPPLAFPQSNRTIRANPTEVDPSRNINELLKQSFASFSEQFLSAKKLMSEPSSTTAGFPRFSSTPIPASMAISALRGNGLADVYAHPLSGPTMERMDRGGETHFG